jgi:hypothetical protein
LGASRLAATLGALWWLASMARWYAGYVGMDDPHLVALAVMTWALAYALRDPNSKRVEGAIVVMVLAGFYKHNLFAIPATTLCWWTLQDYRRGLRLTLLGFGTVAVGFAVCGLVFGQAFFYGLLLPRHYDVTRLGSIGRLQFIAPALIVAAVWATYRRRNPAAQFVSIFMVLAFLSYAGQVPADGVADNAMFELVVAVAIGIGCAFDDLKAIPAVRRWGLERSQVLVVCILMARLLISARLSPYLVLLSPDFRSSLNDRISVMKAETARISAIPGPVVCEVVPLACRFAGKPFVFDAFIVGQLVAAGRFRKRNYPRRSVMGNFASRPLTRGPTSAACRTNDGTIICARSVGSRSLERRPFRAAVTVGAIANVAKQHSTSRICDTRSRLAVGSMRRQTWHRCRRAWRRSFSGWTPRTCRPRSWRRPASACSTLVAWG